MVTDIKSVRSKRAVEYLLARGLTLSDVDKLELQFVTEEKLLELGYKCWNVEQGILMPVHNIHGDDTGASGARLFYHENEGATFGVKRDQPKYLHPSGQKSHMHFPKNVLWDHLDFGAMVYFCESYIKAAIAAKMGVNAVGISGVWGWRSQKSKNGIIPGLDDLPWRDLRLQPVVVFDSNVTEDRPMLYASVRRLLTYLEARYDVVGGIIVLPKPPEDYGEEDWGLDDYFMHYGEAETRRLLRLDPTPVPPDLNTHIELFNDEVRYIRNIKKPLRLEDRMPMGVDEFKVCYGNRWVDVPNAQGDIVRRQLPKLWLEHRNRADADEMVYAPGEEMIIGNNVNIWRGMGVEPAPGGVQWWTQWLECVLPDVSERKWFEQWLAWPLQNLGGKMTTCAFLYGPSGVGKGWLSQMMSRIYGRENSSSIKLHDLIAGFNSHWAAGQFLIVEEAEDIRDNTRVYTALKDLITNEIIEHRRKFVDSFYIDNHLNIMLQGNNLGALGKIDTFDRRLGVLSIDRASSKSIANNVEYWTEMFGYVSDEGAAALYAWLLSVDCSDFDPQGEAPMTAAKRDAIELGLTVYEQFADRLLHEPESVLGDLFTGSWFSTKELYYIMLEGGVAWYELGEREHVSRINALSKVLLNAGVQKANEGKRVKNPYDGKTGTFWVIGSTCNQDEYVTASYELRQDWRNELYGVNCPKF